MKLEMSNIRKTGNFTKMWQRHGTKQLEVKIENENAIEQNLGNAVRAVLGKWVAMRPTLERRKPSLMSYAYNLYLGVWDRRIAVN